MIEMPFALPPGPRIPYDSDGTVGLIQASQNLGGDIFDVHPLALKAMNSHVGAGVSFPTTIWTTYQAGSQVGITSGALSLIFPVPMRLRGYYMSRVTYRGFTSSGDGMNAATSKNSSNSVDGDWESLGTLYRDEIADISDSPITSVSVISGGPGLAGSTYRPMGEKYRKVSAIDGVGIREWGTDQPVRNVRVLKLSPGTVGSTLYAPGVFQLLLFGEPEPSTGGDSLSLWQSTVDLPLKVGGLDWGDSALGSTSDKRFRIKNLSEALTAYEIQIWVEDERNYPFPSPASQFLFSTDGGNSWTTSVTVGALAPDSVSEEILMRRVTPTNALLSTWSPKIRVEPGRWS